MWSRVIQTCGWKHLKASHQCAKFNACRFCGSGDMFSFCQVTSRNHMIKGSCIVGRGFLSLPVLLNSSPFSNCFNHHTCHSFSCLNSLAQCAIVKHYVILLHDMMDPHLLSLDTLLLLEAPCYAFYAARCQLYCRFDTDGMAFASTLTWYHKHIYTHSTYKDQ